MGTGLKLLVRPITRQLRHFSNQLRGVDPELEVNPALFRGFSNAELRSLAPKVARTRFRQELEGVKGWMTRRECQTLHAFARWLPGPILEIGSWVGLSTCSIAYGIKNSGRSKEFVTYDFNPTLRNYRPCRGGIGFYVPADSDEPRGICTVELFERDIKPIMESPDGVIGTLRRNLNRLGLEGYVEIREGHFDQAPVRPYRFVFCDAMHDPEEIKMNAPILKRYLAPGSVLACHDVTQSPENESTIKSYLPIGHSFTIDTLFVGEVVQSSAAC